MTVQADQASGMNLQLVSKQEDRMRSPRQEVMGAVRDCIAPDSGAQSCTRMCSLGILHPVLGWQLHFKFMSSLATDFGVHVSRVSCELPAVRHSSPRPPACPLLCSPRGSGTLVGLLALNPSTCASHRMLAGSSYSRLTLILKTRAKISPWRYLGRVFS